MDVGSSPEMIGLIQKYMEIQARCGVLLIILLVLCVFVLIAMLLPEEKYNLLKVRILPGILMLVLGLYIYQAGMGSNIAEKYFALAEARMVQYQSSETKLLELQDTVEGLKKLVAHYIAQIKVLQ